MLVHGESCDARGVDFAFGGRFPNTPLHRVFGGAPEEVGTWRFASCDFRRITLNPKTSVEKGKGRDWAVGAVASTWSRVIDR